MTRDLQLINWWPRYFKKRSEDIFYLTLDKYTDAIHQMNQIRESTPQSNHQYTHCRTNHPTHYQPHRRTRHTPFYTYYPNTFSALAPVDTPEYSPSIPPIQFTNNEAADSPTHNHHDDTHADYNTTDEKANALFDDCIFIDAVHLPSATDTLSRPNDVSNKPPSSALSASSASSVSSSTTHYQYDDDDHLHSDHLLNHSNYHSNHTSKYHSDQHSHLHSTEHPEKNPHSYHSNTHTDHDSYLYDDDGDSNDTGFEPGDQDDCWKDSNMVYCWFIFCLIR